jgi:hypothetical protein
VKAVLRSALAAAIVPLLGALAGGADGPAGKPPAGEKAAPYGEFVKKGAGFYGPGR